jgi:hypothetical protein
MEAGQRHLDTIVQSSRPPAFMDLQGTAQTGLGLTQCVGKPVHFGSCLQHLGVSHLVIRCHCSGVQRERRALVGITEAELASFARVLVLVFSNISGGTRSSRAAKITVR